MPFQRPKLTEIISRVKTDAESRYGSTCPRRSLISVFSTVIAGAVHSLYGYGEFISKQIFATTAEGKYLERRASEYGIYRRKATKSEGIVTFSGSGTVPEGTQVQTSDEKVYETTADSANGSAPVVAVVAGKEGNIEANTPMSLISPVAGIAMDCVSGEITGGTDEEEDESLRNRLLFRMRNPPKAGTKTDYVAWTKEVSGVTRAWCYPLELGPGHVTIRFMTDGSSENGIPSDVLIERVKKHIEELMPVTTILTVIAPIPQTLNITVDILPDKPEIRTKVISAINQIIQSEAEPGGQVLFSSIDRAVGSIEEIKSYRIVSPDDDVSATTGKIIVPGTITFV